MPHQVPGRLARSPNDTHADQIFKDGFCTPAVTRWSTLGMWPFLHLSVCSWLCFAVVDRLKASFSLQAFEICV